MTQIFEPTDAAGTTPDDGPPLATPRDLWNAVDQLTNKTSRRLSRDTGNYESVTLPSLYDQLIEAMQSGAGGTAHGVQESKPPLDTTALSLLIEIDGHVRWGLRNWSIKRTFVTPKDLRRMTSTVISRGTAAEVDMMCRKVRWWCGQIRLTISSDTDRTWRMHGAACRVCASTTVPAFDDDGNETRIPALIVHSAEGTINKIECGFCGSVLAGEDLAVLVRDTLAAMAQKTA